MKTVREWFNILTDSIKESAIKNTINCQGELYLNTEKFESFELAITHAFTFSETPEGFQYWDKISTEYRV